MRLEGQHPLPRTEEWGSDSGAGGWGGGRTDPEAPGDGASSPFVTSGPQLAGSSPSSGSLGGWRADVPASRQDTEVGAQGHTQQRAHTLHPLKMKS